MSDPAIDEQRQVLEPVHAGEGEPSGEIWATRLVLFLRVMAAVEALFPQIYGGRLWVIIVELALLGAYLWLALLAAREHAP